MRTPQSWPNYKKISLGKIFRITMNKIIDACRNGPQYMLKGTKASKSYIITALVAWLGKLKKGRVSQPKDLLVV